MCVCLLPGDIGARVAGDRLSACHFWTSDRRANDRLRVEDFDVERRILGTEDFEEDVDEPEAPLL